MTDKELFGNSEQLESGHEKDHVADPGKKVDGNMISKTWHSTMKVIAWCPLPEPWKGEET